jgi:uncharacterized protein involved in response to NO
MTDADSPSATLPRGRGPIGPRPICVGLPTMSIRPGRPRRQVALFEDTFRPFYLGGAVFAALAVPIWLAMWRGALPEPAVPPLLWHAHEMVFGFAAAIIIGFLFTAAPRWTGLPVPGGGILGAVFATWVAGRLGMLLGHGVAVAILDTAPLLLVTLVLARQFIRARSRAGLPLVGVLACLTLSNAAFHVSLLGTLRLSPLRAIEIGLMAVIVVQLIIAGRVVPAFTASAIPGVAQRRHRGLERLALLFAVTALGADALQFAPWPRGALSILAAVALGAQMLCWNPWASRGRPILWILHLSYAWIPVGLLLLGLAAIGLVPRSAAVHALTVGSMGGLIIGMITRTALGHTGRPVRAGRAETASYILVHVAAALRLAAALVPAVATAGMLASGAAWTVAFGVYAVSYTPILVRPRLAPAGG